MKHRIHLDISHIDDLWTLDFDSVADACAAAMEDMIECGVPLDEICDCGFRLAKLHQLRIGENIWTVWFGA